MRYLCLVPLLTLAVAGCGQSSNEPTVETNVDRMAWRKLSKGMAPDQVRAVLGEPVRVEEQGEVTCWHYQQGRPLEKDALDPNQWVLARGSLLFATKASGVPELSQWREP